MWATNSPEFTKTAHVLQSCPLHKRERESTWPTESSLGNKLHGTATYWRLMVRFIALPGLQIIQVYIERWRRRIKTKLTMSTSSIWGPQTLQNSSLSGCLCTICNMLLITLDKTCNSDKHFLWDILHGTADPNLVGKKNGLLSYHLYRSSFEHWYSFLICMNTEICMLYTKDRYGSFKVERQREINFGVELFTND